MLVGDFTAHILNVTTGRTADITPQRTPPYRTDFTSVTVAHIASQGISHAVADDQSHAEFPTGMPHSASSKSSASIHRAEH